MKKAHVSAVRLLTGLFLIFLASHVKGQQKSEVFITGIRSAKGKILVQIFKDDASYQDQNPYKKVMFDKKGMTNGTLAVQLQLESGTYGFTMVDDENGNGKIDKNIVGIPKEGFGFSNFFMEKLKKPSFDEIKVEPKAQAEINMKVKYM
ncbi:Uncharacterized conserved protein, DUF2141 family [Pedobacter westerhofensis]|uniref:Uncharacterized conserved protein, DUF2141 family n=1 Tax=Pedobacter westerhofensis TaxID=425512 RepID=A0A521ABL6_9SPHI|nr:DUF2141 domain-containing protein [Pedobacter westerhofensis]SMO32151.1 Uncharacterized conserved protein, DUF2141 family [Pedobacter westerhofensis]